MFELDKDDIKAVARRRARKGLVRKLEYGFFGALALVVAIMVTEILGTKIPKDDWIMGSVAVVGIVLVTVASFVTEVRFRRIFKDLEKEAGLAK